MLPRAMQESDDDNDCMDGSIAASSSSKEDEEQESVWGEPESDASEDESDHEEIDHPEDDDYEGNFHITDGICDANCVHSNTPLGKTHQVGES